MAGKTSISEYLVISRGQWDPDLSENETQRAIDNFYVWHDRLVSEGKMNRGNAWRQKARQFQNMP